MPGRLIEEPDLSNATRNTMTEPAGGGLSNPESSSTPFTNGESTKPPPTENIIQNGLPPPSSSAPQSSVSKGLAQLMQQLPADIPELDHMTDGYQPLSKLFERAAQDCFNSLNATIDNSHHTPSASLVNGNTRHSEGQDSSASTAQRIQWLNFANSHRERFLKLLVLLQWGRQSRQDIGRLVDVFAWMRRLSDYYDAVEDELGAFKRDLSTYKVPRPDIQTALETLSTGRSVNLPDLNYIPRPPISAKATLQTIQNVNCILHLRLNVHQDLPPHLRRFKIDSGRVTFTIPHEFALDLSVYDEDPLSPFYFVDFRFLFSPSCSEIPIGVLRSDLELRCNAVLASEGLNACYDLVHDFVLTYKLGILRQQALYLTQGAWADALRIERVHRSLILQYWISSHQKKSWLEIGVNSGKTAEAAPAAAPKPWKHAALSHLTVKWVRAGEVVSNANLSTLDQDKLNLEQLLKQAVKLHTEYLLGLAQQKLPGTEGAGVMQTPYLTTAEVDDQSSVSLAIPLYQNKTSFLAIEPISGKFSISPRTSSSARCEDRLDSLKHPEQELLSKLQGWRAYDGAEMIRSNAVRFGWNVVRSIQLDAATRKQYFGDEFGSLTLLKHWKNPDWFLAALPNNRLKFSFWVVQIVKATPTLWSSEGFEVRQCRKLPADVKSLSVQVFTRLYRWSVAAISSQVVRQGLKELKVSFVPLNPIGKLSSNPFPPLWIDLSRYMGLSKTTSNVVLCHCGPQARSENSEASGGPAVYHVLKGRLNDARSSNMNSRSIHAPDVSFRDDGGFAILNRSAVGSVEVVQNLLDRLRHVLLLQNCLETLKRRRFEVESAGLNSLTFSYAQTPKKLQASLSWSERGMISLALTPADNPHRRMFEPLQKMLQPNSTTISKVTTSAALLFSGFTRLLSDTLQILQAFDKVEAHGDVVVQIDSTDKYRMEYDLPNCSIQITYQRKQDAAWWYFQQAKRSSQSNEKLEAAIQQKMSESGRGILGFSHGVACDSQAAADFVVQLDESIRACVTAEERKQRHILVQERATKAKVSEQKEKENTSQPAQGKEQNQTKPQTQTAKGSKPQAKDNNAGTSNGVKQNEPDVVVLE